MKFDIMALNSLLSCPQEETYHIRKSVLNYLLRSRQDSSSSKIQCPFDPFHVVDEKYFENHVLNCASSGNVEAELYNFQSTNIGSVPLEVVKKLSVPLMDDWREENVKMYDPWRNTETRNIIRCLMGGTKSERRLFKLSERRRIENLEKCGIIDSNLKKDFKHKKSAKCINISWLIRNMKTLTLEDLEDILLKNIDISKLLISNDNNTVVDTKQVSEIVEEVRDILVHIKITY